MYSAGRELLLIRWLGRLGRCVGTSYHASFWCVCSVDSGCVLGHLIVNHDVHLHYITMMLWL